MSINLDSQLLERFEEGVGLSMLSQTEAVAQLCLDRISTFVFHYFSLIILLSAIGVSKEKLSGAGN